jgi:hypothetical protein
MKKTTNSSSFKASLAKLTGSGFTGTKVSGLSKTTKLSHGINFGKAPGSATLVPSSSSGGGWQTYASQLASGGAVSILTGSYGAGALGGFGLGPIVSGILGLFGNKQKSPPALQPFSLPSASNQTVHLEAGSSSASGSSNVVHVHVQAMDSQSFMDRSNEIANAVKSAMLNSHSLNDVVSEV